MRIEVFFEDGRKQILEGVESFREIDQEKKHEISRKPEEGKLFRVEPLNINKKLFEEQKNDKSQEFARRIIKDAFRKVEQNPNRYSTPFWTLVPENKWNYNEIKNEKELRDYALDSGGQMADWIEQALEWAQRIQNGESWEKLCNNPDTLRFYRMIEWKDGEPKIVGGSTEENYTYSPTHIFLRLVYSCKRGVPYTVPLIVIR